MKIGFAYPGGKAKIFKQLFEHFEHVGRWYIEPFAGRGNIFFNFFQVACFEQYFINDLNTGRFFKAIKEADFSKLPLEMSPMEFESLRWRSESGDPIAIALEPVITFSGRGYSNGSNLGHYDFNRYYQKFKFIQGILNDSRIKLSATNWENLPWDNFNSEDFIYCDPPYYKEDGYSYKNIDHEELIHRLRTTDANWCISGWLNELYEDLLGEPILKFERRKDMVAGSQGIEVVVDECLWRS